MGVVFVALVVVWHSPVPFCIDPLLAVSSIIAIYRYALILSPRAVFVKGVVAESGRSW
jgi:hypothetical protein